MKLRKIMTIAAALSMSVSVLSGCASNANASEAVVFYSNADDEVIECIETVLKDNGYEGKYIFQSLGTSELGGKMLAEGKNIEADFMTMASYYVDSAQADNQMFQELTFDVNSLVEFPSIAAPTTSQEGAIFVNTGLMAEKNLPMPTSLKDLADPVYKDMLSVADISSSSTAWLFIQAIMDAYGDGAEGKQILTDIYKNAGAHIESSGSGPIKKVRAGEVAIGFGLRHQAVADKKAGLPIDYIDPIEGNFSLMEVISVVDKGENTNPLAMEMVQCIIENARPSLMEYYPNAVYEGEVTDASNAAKYPKVFAEPLSVELLEKHVAFSEECKAEARK